MASSQTQTPIPRTVSDILDKHANKIIFIEEWCNEKVYKTHFSFGYKDKEKKLIVLNGDGGGTTCTLVDGSAKAEIEKDEFILCNDQQEIDIKLRLFVAAPLDVNA